MAMGNLMVFRYRCFGRWRGFFANLIPGLVVVGALAVSQPASAITYTFSLPVGTQVSPNPNTLLWALAGSITNNGATGYNATPTSYAFYDFYIRPQVLGDGCLVSTPADGCTGLDTHGNNMAGGNSIGASGNTFNLISDYSMATSVVTPPVPGCVSPIAPGCVSTYTGAPNVTEPSKGGASADFTFNAADNTIALVTQNTNANNQSYGAGGNPPFPTTATAEIMPSTGNFVFSLTTTANNGFFSAPITFEIYGVNVEYTTSSATSLGTKGNVVFTDLNLVGSAPEPSTILVAGSGLCLLLLTRLRRKSKA